MLCEQALIHVAVRIFLVSMSLWLGRIVDWVHLENDTLLKGGKLFFF